MHIYMYVLSFSKTFKPIQYHFLNIFLYNKFIMWYLLKLREESVSKESSHAHFLKLTHQIRMLQQWAIFFLSPLLIDIWLSGSIALDENKYKVPIHFHWLSMGFDRKQRKLSGSHSRGEKKKFSGSLTVRGRSLDSIFYGVLWTLCVYNIWRERNRWMFLRVQLDISQLVRSIIGFVRAKLLSWSKLGPC